jgi:triosephosphate isomerase
MAKSDIEEQKNYAVAAQNCYSKKSGAYTVKYQLKCFVLLISIIV